MGSASLDVTRSALPISGVGADRPEAPPVPDFPRAEVSMEPPQKDEDARRANRLQALLGTLGATIAAAGDDPMMLNIGAGLAEGGAEDLKRRKQSFAKRQQAFQQAVSDANEFNRQQRQREVEAQYERALSGFEQARKDRRQRAEATNELFAEEREQQFDKRQARREHERAMEEIEARGRQRRKTARMRQSQDNGQQDAPAVQGYEAKKVRTQDGWKVWEMQDGEPVGQHGGLTEQEADSLVRELNRRGATDAPHPAPADSAETGATSDTTTTRGIGDRPDGTFVPAGQLGMTTGGVGGGGTSDPSHGDTPLDDMGGLAPLDARSTRQLVDDALDVAWEQGPDEARRQLNRLAEQGQLSAGRAAQIKERMAAVRELDRIAVDRSPQVALDTLDVMRREGDITPQQARRLKSRVQQRHVRR